MLYLIHCSIKQTRYQKKYLCFLGIQLIDLLKSITNRQSDQLKYLLKDILFSQIIQQKIKQQQYVIFQFIFPILQLFNFINLYINMSQMMKKETPSVTSVNSPLLQKVKSEDDPNQTPKSSSKITKKKLDLKRLQSLTNIDIGDFKAFVVGICGGDCAGKKEMIHYMFQQKNQSWYIGDSTEQVSILHQDYFQDVNKPFSSEGTNWYNFYQTARNLIIGNSAIIDVKKTGKKLTLKPTKLLILEGSHIFMDTPQIKHLSQLINTKVFIDSDSDVRLSRRIYKDTQDNNIDLEASIQNYLEHIKPSYQKQIQPSKVNSDIILPHFGGGYDDHRKKSQMHYDSNIKNACSLIISHVRQQMKKYQEQTLEVENEDVFADKV